MMSDFIGELNLTDEFGNKLKVRQYKESTDLLLYSEDGCFELTPSVAKELGKWLLGDEE